MAITATEARKRLFPLIQEVNDDATTIEIVSKNGSAFLMSAAEYRSLRETEYLLRSPANARRLLRSLEDARAGNVVERELLPDE
jgi:antitoxin YefM